MLVFISNILSWTSSVYPINKYFDKYSFNSNFSQKNSLTRGKLGDGTKEVTSDYTSEIGRWYGDFNYFLSGVNSWCLRSGFMNDQTRGGIYYIWKLSEGQPYTSRSSRPVLTITRNMPWLNEQVAEPGE